MDTLVGFLAMSVPGWYRRQGLIVITVYVLYLVAPLPESTWRPLGWSAGAADGQLGSGCAGVRFDPGRVYPAGERGARFVRL